MRPDILPPARIIVRLIAWSGLAAGAVWLWPGSERPSSFRIVEAGGVRIIKRYVDGGEGSTRRTALEIYLPPPEAIWISGPGGERSSSSVLGPVNERAGPSSGSKPAPRARRPAVVAIHGGSWIGGSPRLYRLDSENTVVRLARAGLVVVAPEYRLARPGDPSWPAVLAELRDVVRWVRRHAHELEIDPDRIAALGQSAGGQLAALLGTLPDEPRPAGESGRVNAVIDFYGPSDLASLVETRHLEHEPVRILLGERAANDPARLREASPIEHVTNDDAPMLLLHGSDDAWVPPQQSARLAAALERAGVRHKLILVEGVRHGFEAQVNTVPRRDLLPEILGFLRGAWD